MISGMKERYWLRVKYLILGLAILFGGLLIYLLFRPNAYISKCISQFIQLDVSKNFSVMDSAFIRFYLADYLWAVSLSCFMRCIFIDEQELFCFVVVCFTGISYEILQFSGVVSGTGDICDCLMYLLAALTVKIINLNFYTQKETS